MTRFLDSMTSRRISESSRSDSTLGSVGFPIFLFGPEPVSAGSRIARQIPAILPTRCFQRLPYHVWGGASPRPAAARERTAQPQRQEATAAESEIFKPARS